MFMKTERRLMRTMAVVTFSCAPILLAQGSDLATVSGTIATMDYGQRVFVQNVKVRFQDSAGSTLAVTGSETGRYEASLPAGRYTMTVMKTGFCPAHRPVFQVIANSSVEFDFTLTTECTGDRVAVSCPDVCFDSPNSDAYFDSPIPAYFEEKIPFSNKDSGSVIISFGRRRRTGHIFRYSPLTIKEHPGVNLPVTISFGTYTVKAEEALLDDNLKTMRVLQSVSIADGSSVPPSILSCAVIRLGDRKPKPHSCGQ